MKRSKSRGKKKAVKATAPPRESLTGEIDIQLKNLKSKRNDLPSELFTINSV